MAFREHSNWRISYCRLLYGSVVILTGIDDRIYNILGPENAVSHTYEDSISFALLSFATFLYPISTFSPLLLTCKEFLSCQLGWVSWALIAKQHVSLRMALLSHLGVRFFAPSLLTESIKMSCSLENRSTDRLFHFRFAGNAEAEAVVPRNIYSPLTSTLLFDNPTSFSLSRRD